MSFETRIMAVMKMVIQQNKATYKTNEAINKPNRVGILPMELLGYSTPLS